MKNTKLEIISFADELRKISWFSHLGKPLSNDNWTALSSFRQAKQYMSRNKWLNFKVTLCDNIKDAFSDHFTSLEEEDEVNEHVEKVIEVVYSEIASNSRYAQVLAEDAFGRMVKLDLLAAGQEVIVKDMVPDFFSGRLIEIYRAGHLPCGWDGKMMSEDWRGQNMEQLPEGRSRVY